MKILKSYCAAAAMLLPLVVAGTAEAATLGEARNAYSTHLTVRAKAPQDYESSAVPIGAKEVSYMSGELRLRAWLSTARPGKAAPAVVFLHGGFAASAEDWAAANELVKQGYILLMPQLRGENGNAGNFEMFGGEVDDVIAAGVYLQSVPGVDPRRVYVMGHSVGGSLAILAAQMRSPYKASASLSGYARLTEWIDHFARLAPFDLKNASERTIRDPYLYVSSLQVPLLMFTEEANPHAVEVNRAFCMQVARTSPCQHLAIKGDHQTMIVPAIRAAITGFRSLP
jgi:dipeptidyl aminopeptidase/acylaminoacyl peptidase